MTGPQVHSHHTRNTSNDNNTCSEASIDCWLLWGGGGGGWSVQISNTTKETLSCWKKKAPDSGVGCHFAPTGMHPFVYQRCRHRCKLVRTEEETKLVLLSMKLCTCVIGPETLHFHGAPTWTPDQVSVQRTTINSAIL